MYKLVMAAILLAGLAQAGRALTVEERLVSGLQDQGYTVLEKGYTFLGRLRIVAENDLIHREIVVNPGTGEILRDYAIYLSDMSPPVLAAPNGQASNRDRKSSPAAPAPAMTVTRGVAIGTADVAASSLTPGTNTIGPSSLEVDIRQIDPALPLDATILPMSSDPP